MKKLARDNDSSPSNPPCLVVAYDTSLSNIDHNFACIEHMDHLGLCADRGLDGNVQHEKRFTRKDYWTYVIFIKENVGREEKGSVFGSY